MLHVPAATSATMFPETVHTIFVVHTKPAGNPELAVALIANGNVPNGWLDSRNWVIANQRMAAVMKAKGYQYQLVYAKNAGHLDAKVINLTP